MIRCFLADKKKDIILFATLFTGQPGKKGVFLSCDVILSEEDTILCADNDLFSYPIDGMVDGKKKRRDSMEPNLKRYDAI